MQEISKVDKTNWFNLHGLTANTSLLYSYFFLAWKPFELNSVHYYLLLIGLAPIENTNSEAVEGPSLPEWRFSSSSASTGEYWILVGVHLLIRTTQSSQRSDSLYIIGRISRVVRIAYCHSKGQYSTKI